MPSFVPGTWTGLAVLAVALLAACSPAEPSMQVSLNSPDSMGCKAMLAEPANAGCNVVVAFGSYATGIDGTRLDLIQAWAGEHPDLVRSSRSALQPGAREGERYLCLVTTSRNATEEAYQAIKSIGGTSARGSIRSCTDTGHSFQASDVVDHGGDEGRR